jgi:hypothetical protein
MTTLETQTHSPSLSRSPNESLPIMWQKFSHVITVSQKFVVPATECPWE